MGGVASEQVAEAAEANGAKISVVRLPPSVHGDGDHGFVPMFIDIAKQKGAAAYVGEGLNRWPAVHRLDAALLYRQVLESGAEHSRYHAIGDEGVPFKAIAAIIGKKLDLPVVSKSPEDAAEHFGWMTHFAGMNSPASSAQTREWLGWQPRHVALIPDLEQGTYFQS